MKLHDQVRVKKTVFATPWFDATPIEIKAGWEGAIVDRPDGEEPAIEFYDETVTGRNILVDLDRNNLEVLWSRE